MTTLAKLKEQNPERVFQKLSDGSQAPTSIKLHTTPEVVTDKDFESIKRENPKIKNLNKERIKIFRGSDETQDRYGDVVSVKGWDLKNYKLNPVFLWGHKQSEIPVGRAVKVKKEYNDNGAPNKRSLMFWIFFPEGVEKSEQVFQGYDSGLINATSVGFLPLEGEYPSDPERRVELGLGKYGTYFKKQELLELSGVSVPANANAVELSSPEAKKHLTVKQLALAKSLDLEYIEVNKDHSEQEPEEYNEEEMKTLINALSEQVKSLLEIINGLDSKVKEINERVDDSVILLGEMKEDQSELIHKATFGIHQKDDQNSSSEDNDTDPKSNEKSTIDVLKNLVPEFLNNKGDQDG